MKRVFIIALCAIFTFSSCCSQESVSNAVVKTGIDVLQENGFKQLKGKRVGLVTNPTGVNKDLVSTVDVLFEAEGVELVALFGPEHGVRGDIHAGAKVEDLVDEKTGLKMLSLYGKTRKATPEMLEGIDVMVYDIQDNGCRSFTYISTMGLLMEACAEQGIEVMILDRPNPLSGLKVEGSVVEPGYFSFVSQFEIPYIYGLTCGELATMLNEEGMLKGEKGNNDTILKCNLTVIPMEGWTRDMMFQDTKLPWILPSPHVPQPESAYFYPASGIVGELTNYLNIGVGYTLPFQLFTAEWINGQEFSDALNALELPGVVFRPIHIKPFYGGLQGKSLQGVQFYYTDFQAAPASLINFYAMQVVAELYPDHKPFETADPGRFRMFDLVTGSANIRETFSKSYKVSDIEEYWNKDVESFKEKSKKYYLYQ